MANLTTTRTRNKTFNSTQAGTRIIKVAAFCFAVISWLATAEGLRMYVFNYAWQAHLVSFGVQSILFVLNLKLPYYFKLLGRRNSSPKEHRNHLFQVAIAAFYVVAMLFSSFFSFVHISNSVVYGHDSGYSDDNTVLANSFRHILDKTEKYIDENIKATQIVAGKQLAALQMEMGTIDDSYVVETFEALQNSVAEADLVYKNASVAKDNAQRVCNAKYEYVQSLYGVRFVNPEKYFAAQQDYERALKDVSDAERALNSAFANLEAVTERLTDWEKSDSAITSVFLVELLSESPNPEILDKNMASLMERVTQLGENKRIPSNFAVIVQKAQAMRITLRQYLTLRKINTEGKLFALSDTQTAYNITIPSPSSSSFGEQRLSWQKFWQSQYGELKKLIQQLPSYNTAYAEDLADSWIDVDLLEDYEKDQLMSEIDNLLRNCTTDINVIEKSVNLIRGEYPFAAVFSAIIAVFLDLSSFFAGLFLYGISRKNTQKENLGEDIYTLA